MSALQRRFRRRWGDHVPRYIAWAARRAAAGERVPLLCSPPLEESVTAGVTAVPGFDGDAQMGARALGYDSHVALVSA